MPWTFSMTATFRCFACHQPVRILPGEANGDLMSVAGLAPHPAYPGSYQRVMVPDRPPRGTRLWVAECETCGTRYGWDERAFQADATAYFVDEFYRAAERAERVPRRGARAIDLEETGDGTQ